MSRFEELTISSTNNVTGGLERLKGSIESLSLDGPEEPLVQIVKKINEIVDKVNALDIKSDPLYVEAPL